MLIKVFVVVILFGVCQSLAIDSTLFNKQRHESEKILKFN